MKGLFKIISATLSGGFFVVLPIMILYVMLGETLDMATKLAAPIVDLLPEDLTKGTRFPTLIAIALILLVSLVFGLLIRTSWGSSLIEEAERRVLEKLPGYSTVRSLSRSFLGDKIEGQFEPALLSLPMDGKAPVFVVEWHDDGYCTVLLPMSPTPGVGTIQVVPGDRVQRLDVGAGPMFDALSHWGTGIGDLVRRP